jgi:hypothetical protein
MDPLPPVAIPVIVSVPVDTFRDPHEFKLGPPVEFPVIIAFPEDALFNPTETDPVDPIEFPVINIDPKLLLLTPKDDDALPPVTLPVIFSVPVEVLFAPKALLTVPPVTFPTIVPTAGEAAVNCRQLREVVVDLFVTLAVSVTPDASVKMPVPALLTSSQVVSTSIVIVWPVLARASSPTVGTTPPVHVAPAEKLPLAALVMRAMAYSPFACR